MNKPAFRIQIEIFKLRNNGIIWIISAKMDWDTTNLPEVYNKFERHAKNLEKDI